MSLSIPFTFVGGPGNKARASEVNANFLAVASKFTEGVGGIVDGDIAAGAGIKGSKISNAPGFRITTDRIEDLAITTDKLGPLAVTTAKVALLNIDNTLLSLGAAKENLAATPAAYNGLDITQHQFNYSQGFTLIANQARVLMTSANPSIAFPTATWELLACYAQNPSITGTTGVQYSLAVMPDESTANWQGTVSLTAFHNAGASNTVLASIIYVFIKRV